ncbi:MAG: hypothetical protein ACKVRP_08290 [Bacteroidota bacterium]
MKTRKLHRIIGVTLLLPFVGWAVTGLIFFIKPGYADAYDMLTVKTYPLGGSTQVRPDSAWHEFRYFRTILGDHLIVRSADGWQHLDPQSLNPRDPPMEDQIRKLVGDAFTANSQRYGNVSRVSGDSISTDTGIEVTLDWTRLSLYQRGKDTDRIDLLYKIHYLQWTGVDSVDKFLGLAGLVLVLLLTVLGARLAFKAN